MPLDADGENVRDMLHLGDHCRGIALVLVVGAAGVAEWYCNDREWGCRSSSAPAYELRPSSGVDCRGPKEKGK